MFNQEQLAAIAAAMSILQQSMQSNNHSTQQPQNGTSPSDIASSNNNSTTTQPNAYNPHVIQQHLAALAESRLNLGTNGSIGSGNGGIGSELESDLQSNQLASLRTLAQMEAALASVSLSSDQDHDHLQLQQHQRQQTHQIAPPASTTNHASGNGIINSPQHPLFNQYQSQFERPELTNLVTSPLKQPVNTHQSLDEHQQQLLVNHLRAIQQQQQQQQQQHQNHQQDQLQLNQTSSPKMLQQQQHQQQQQQNLLDHYQAQIQQHQQQHHHHHHQPQQIQHQHPHHHSDLHHLTRSPPKAPQMVIPQQQPQQQPQLNQRQQPHNHIQEQRTNQQQQQQPPQQQQQPPQQVQTPTQVNVVKSNKPISYSAIVAKSAGLNTGLSNTSTTNNNTTSNNSTLASVSNYVNGNPSTNITINHNKSTNSPASNNTFGGLQNNVNSQASPFSATNSIAKSPDSISKTSGLHSNGTIDNQPLRSNPLSSPNYIVRNSLNHHIGSSTNNDIFNTNLAGSSLGHPNGSLLKQHNNNNNNNNLLALEPTLNYTTDHSTSPAHQLSFNQGPNPLRHHQIQSPLQQNHHQNNHNSSNINNIGINSSNSVYKSSPPHGQATNLLGFMGLYVGNLSPDLTKEQLEKIFSKYGEPVKAHRLIRSPVAFIKYENTESPRAAIDDLYGLLLPELTLNQDQPLKLHFDRNDVQLKANYRPVELPKDDNGECYGWRTTVCRRGKNCPKKHIPINRGIDFQMWMIKSTPTLATTTSTPFTTTIS